MSLKSAAQFIVAESTSKNYFLTALSASAFSLAFLLMTSAFS